MISGFLEVGRPEIPPVHPEGLSTMGLRHSIAVVFGWAACLIVPTADGADKGTSITWKRTVVEDKFRSEGVAVADVNKDGKNDVLIGDFWYEAPNWKAMDPDLVNKRPSISF